MSCKLFDIAAFWPSKHMVIRADGVIVNDENHPSCELFQWDYIALKSAVLLDATSCVGVYNDWGKRHVGEEHDNVIQKNFTKATPPWANCFVYGPTVGDVRSESFGLHVQTFPTSGEGERYLVSLSSPFARAKYVCVCRLWFKRRGLLTVVSGLQPWFAFIDECGQILGMLTARTTETGHVIQRGSPLIEQTYLFAFWVFQLSHCKNVVVREGVRLAKMPKGKRAHPPKLSYRTLMISESPSTTAKSNSSETGQTAKHVCRGNFAHYTEENKLFGKYVGMFWRPMHIKGNAKHGIVGKEYTL